MYCEVYTVVAVIIIVSSNARASTVVHGIDAVTSSYGQDSHDGVYDCSGVAVVVGVSSSSSQSYYYCRIDLYFLLLNL